MATLSELITEYGNSLARIEAEKSLLNGTLDSISEIQRIIDLAGETQ